MPISIADKNQDIRKALYFIELNFMLLWLCKIIVCSRFTRGNDKPFL